MVDTARHAEIRFLVYRVGRTLRGCGDSLCADPEFVTLEKTL
ncbi:MAG: hypothetical protein V4618_00030 [Pseudomonadota bacterium]